MTKLLHETLNRNLVFISGKGGVGKSAVAEAIARFHAQMGKKTLLVEFENPVHDRGEIEGIDANLWHLNCDASLAFEEYAALKIGIPALVRIFLRNRLMQYLAEAAPGIHELVLLGKVWHERKNYDHVIVDMPSTGYGVAMFNSPKNFAELFRGGPVHADSQAMTDTFNDPHCTGSVIVAIPEEMPLQEAIELNEYMNSLFPNNPSAFVVNKCFPKIQQDLSGNSLILKSPMDWKSPYASSATEYTERRAFLEKFNVQLFNQREIEYFEIPYLICGASQLPFEICGELKRHA